jgi:hypothetical protein
MRLSEKDKDLLCEIITENTEIVVENEFAVFEKLDIEAITQGILKWFLKKITKTVDK